MPQIQSVTEFGSVIREERRRQNPTQTDLAEYCGVGINFVSEVERGKPTAEMGKALRLAEMLGLDIHIERRGA